MQAKHLSKLVTGKYSSYMTTWHQTATLLPDYLADVLAAFHKNNSYRSAPLHIESTPAAQVEQGKWKYR